MNERLDLTSLGSLNADVRALLPDLVQSLPLDDATARAALDIHIEIKRLPDTTTLVGLTYTVRPKFPKRSQSILARSDLGGALRVDPADMPDRTLDLRFETIEEDA